MDYLLSGFTIVSVWLMGNKSIAGPVVGIVGNILWAIYAINLMQYGLLVGTAAMMIVHVRNLVKWRKDANTS